MGQWLVKRPVLWMMVLALVFVLAPCAVAQADDPPFGLTVTAPNGGETIAGELGQTTTVTWTVTAAQSQGRFGVWAVSSGGSWIRLGTVMAVENQTEYSFAWKQAQTAGDYRVCVTYGLTEGTWTAQDYSDASFTITSAGLAVTSPNGGETIAGELGQTTTVTWTIAAAPASGRFGVWAVSAAGSWIRLGTVQALENQTEYSFAWKQSQAAGNYRVCVTYGLTEGDWTVRDYSDTQFTVTSAGLAVTSPNGGETIAGELGQMTNVTWTIAAAPTSGRFGVWAVSAAGTWIRLGTVDAVAAQTDYSFAWKQAQAAGDYRVCITYGPTEGDWTVRDYSDAQFTVTSAGLAVTSPNGGEQIAGETGATTTVTWTIAAAPPAVASASGPSRPPALGSALAPSMPSPPRPTTASPGSKRRPPVTTASASPTG